MIYIILYVLIGITISVIGEYKIGKDSDGTFGIVMLIGWFPFLLIALVASLFYIPFGILKIINKFKNNNNEKTEIT